jgi:4-hydroxybenzoyl-CoA thioesterase
MSFCKTVKVRFSDTDPAGVMYFPRFLDRFHGVFEDWFDEQLGMPYHWVLEETAIGFPTVHTECDYRKPCRFGELLEIELSVVRVGGRSFTCTYKVRAQGAREVRVQASLVTATVSLEDFKPVEIPDLLRSRLLERLEPPVSEVAAPPRSVASSG